MSAAAELERARQARETAAREQQADQDARAAGSNAAAAQSGGQR